MNEKINVKGISMIDKIGEGSQGEVWHVRKDGRDYAMKRYSEQSATQDQRAIIQHLIQTGPPAKYASRFAWPLELVESVEGEFIGYLMPLIDTTQYISFEEIECGLARHPGFKPISIACRQLAECFRELHVEGFCCRDISKGNFMFNPKTGDVIICDNDNIAVDNSGKSDVLGTPEYMAAEVVLGIADPSTITDQHSLSVLLFILLCAGNPFHGSREHNIHILDGVASEYLYGSEPVFVFDPVDRSNSLPDEPGYRHVAKYWSILPMAIQRLFIKAFTKGTKDPSTRITAVEWISALTHLEGLLHRCSCGAENFWDPERQDQQICWNKGCSVNFPKKLYITGKSNAALLVYPGQTITSTHLGEISNTMEVGKMEKHPNDSSLSLLRNKTTETWNAELGNEQVEVPPQKAIPLHTGIAIKTANHEMIVYP